MFKKMMLLLALAFSLVSTVGAMTPTQQYPLPGPPGNPNLTLQF